MDTETLTQVGKVIVASALSLALGAIVMSLVLRAYGVLMDAISPGAWLVICVVALVVGAAIGGFLFGTAQP